MNKKKASDSDIIAHLTKLQVVGTATHPSRSETGGMILNRPPASSTITIQEMLAAEAQTSPQSSDNGAPLSGHPLVQRRRISLDLIDDSRYQPRKEYDPEEIDALAHTIAAGGQADPIKIRPYGDRFELISGHRRVRAARSLGWADIDALIEEKSDRQAEIEVMLTCIGNVALSDFEFAKMCQRALTQGFVKKQVEAANFFGCTQSKVSGCLTMLELPEAIQAMLQKKPSLFSYTTAKTISELLEAHPGHGAVIVAGVDRLFTGMKQSALKGWVNQALSQLGKDSRPTKTRKTITKKGVPVFVTKMDPRAITITLKAPSMDVLEFEGKLRSFLESEAEKYEDKN